MVAIENETNALGRLNNIIREGKKVLVFDSTDRDFLMYLRKEINDRNNPDVEIWQHIEESADYVSKNDIDKALEMYYLYDFSDKIVVISDSAQYGSMFNYVKNGIMIKQEMAEALLCKIC